jgi:hypothetical protein
MVVSWNLKDSKKDTSFSLYTHIKTKCRKKEKLVTHRKSLAYETNFGGRGFRTVLSSFQLLCPGISSIVIEWLKREGKNIAMVIAWHKKHQGIEDARK